MNKTIPDTPQRVMGFYDIPFWEHIAQRSMKLQRCDDCATFRYPPGPACPACLSDDHQWVALCGEATILSWVIFHRSYLPAYPAPLNVIAVRLAEGPTMISNLEGPHPCGSWIGHPIKLVYSAMPDGILLPRFCLAS